MAHEINPKINYDKIESNIGEIQSKIDKLDKRMKDQKRWKKHR